MITKTTRSLTTFLLLIVSAIGTSQTNSGWIKQFEHTKAFIENKGQFVTNNNVNNEPILFGVDNGGTKIYFTKKGITYTFFETKQKKKDERELERERNKTFASAEAYKEFEKEEHQLNIKTDQVTMLWQNANNNIQIEASGVTSDYHSYSFKENGLDKNVSFIKGYEKITYKNIYPHIDIEYTFATKGGLKYNVLLHPGANPTDIKMVYDKQVNLDNKGNVAITTKFGNIIDHAPLSFYQNNLASIIASKFIKSGKTISFQLDNYDNTKEAVIDPWVQTPAYISNWDCVWECERDGAGNVYTFGGVTPVVIRKYNNAGVQQWTYNTPYDTTSWIGTIATDNAGNSYVTNGTAAGIIKLNTAGVLQWTVGGGGLAEYWNISFNCDQTKLIVGGTDNLRGAIFDINTVNGAILATKIVAFGSAFAFPPSIQEVRALSPSGNGRYYFLTLDSIGYINQNLNLCGTNSAIFKTTSTHGFSYKCENFRYDNTGIMAIRADLNFVYTHNGTTLFKRSLSNTAIIASVTIPGGAATTSLGQKAVSCAGIDIDVNGNIYVGSTNAVTKFSPALVQLATVAVPFNVYDVHVSTSGDVIACGSTGNSGSASRTGYIQSISSLSAANSLSLTCCDVNVCQPSNICSNAAPFTMIASTPGGTWSGTGITNATTGAFNPAIAGVGVHIITYSLACGSSTTAVNVISCGTMSVCNNAGTLTVTGGSGPYSWASTSTSISCAACPGGNCIPFICAGVSVPTWTASGSAVTAPTAGTFPIKLTDGGSATTITLTTLAGIPSCSVSICPTLTLSVSSQTNVNCFGASTGTATINSIGGVGPYTYTWMPGNLSGVSQSALAAGVYTVSVRDINLCLGTITITITQPAAALNANITATTQATCGQSNASATVVASGGTAGYTYSWQPTGGIASTTNTLGVGSFTIRITDAKGCTVTAVSNITSASGPTLSVVSQTNVNCFGASTGSATINSIGGTGPYTYTWMPGNFNGATQINLAAGIYTITNADNASCAGTGTVSITQPLSALTGSLNTLPATCGVSNGAATVTATGGTAGYTYLWSPSGITTNTNSALASGNSSVTITDAKSCTITLNVSITSVSGPTLSIVSQTNVNCFGASTGSATVSSIGGAGPYTYTWMPGNLNGASQSNLAAGIYIITNADNGGCTGSGTVNITQPSSVVSGSIIGSTPVTCGLTNGSATVQASGGTPGYTYNWVPSGGNAATTNLLAAGSASVIITDIKGCTRTITLSLISTTGPTLSVVSQTNVNCFAANTGSATVNSIGGAGPYTYTWIPGNLNGASQSNLTAGIYTITNTDNAGCVGTSTINITQGTVIAGIVATPTTGIAPVTVNFFEQCIGATSFNWSFGNGSSNSSIANPTTIYNSNGTYTVMLIASSGSCYDTAYVTIVIEDGLTLEIPNVFTPNGDGINDLFSVKSTGVKEITLQVFNRWGEKLHEFTGPKVGWDGLTGAGAKVPDGTYFYFVKAVGYNDKEIEQHGTFNLFR